MATVLLIIHLFVTITLIGVVLLQRSEGGGLGIGSSQGMGSFMSGRGTANLLTRTTAILGALFFALSLALAIINRGSGQQRSILVPPAAPAPGPLVPGALVPGAPPLGGLVPGAPPAGLLPPGGVPTVPGTVVPPAGAPVAPAAPAAVPVAPAAIAPAAPAPAAPAAAAPAAPAPAAPAAPAE